MSDSSSSSSAGHRRVRKAVITAAGKGTRQYPASSIVQKELFPLVDRDGLTKPVIQIIIEELLGSGIEEICIITQPGEERIYRDYFKPLTGPDAERFKGKTAALEMSGKLADYGRRLHFAVQHSPEGFGHAVYQARGFVGDEPFVLMLGDHLYISDTQVRCTRQLIDVYESASKTQPCSAVTGVQPTLEKHLHLFGALRGTPSALGEGIYTADLIVEKPSIELARAQLATPGLPAGNFLCHFGIHVFAPAIFESLEHLIRNDLREKGEIQLTAAQEHLRQTMGRYVVSVVHGLRLDTGIPFGLMETQIALALHSTHRRDACESIARLLAMQGR